jgi:hypothetical protein
MSSRGWIGVDLDGTLAVYAGWQGAHHIGPPVPLMLERVKRWLAEGQEVRIFTARVSDPDSSAARAAIDAWCLAQFGHTLPITNVKDFNMRELWDDRAITVEQNTGRAIGERQDRFTP